MKSAIRWIIAVLCLLVLGIFAWRITSRRVRMSENNLSASQNHEADEKIEFAGTVAVIGDTPIAKDDLDWEIAIHTELPEFSNTDLGIVASKPKPSTSPSPSVSASPESTAVSASPLPPSKALSQRILVTLIERKMLYKWIKENSEGFDFNNPGRYVDCLSNLKEVISNHPNFFANSPSKDRMKSKLCEQSIIDQYLHEKVLGSVSATDDEALKWYSSHKSEFNDPPKVVFRQILLPTDKAAVELRPKVNRSNFNEMARQHSIAAEAPKGGKVGPFAKEQLPSFFEIVFTMQIGEISGIVRSDYGYHILMPVEHLPARHRPFAEVKAQIRTKLTEQKKQEAYQTWLTTVMNTIPVSSSSAD